MAGAEHDRGGTNTPLTTRFYPECRRYDRTRARPRRHQHTTDILIFLECRRCGKCQMGAVQFFRNVVRVAKPECALYLSFHFPRSYLENRTSPVSIIHVAALKNKYFQECRACGKTGMRLKHTIDNLVLSRVSSLWQDPSATAATPTHR